VIGLDPRDVLHEDIGDTSLWTRVNIAEAFPGVPTPLTWSWAGPASDIGVCGAWVRMGVLPRRRSERQPIVSDRMVAIYHGRAVLNLGVLREIGDAIPGTSGNDVERQLFSSEAVNEPDHPNRRRYPLVAAKLPAVVVRARRALLWGLSRTERWWRESVAALSCAPPALLPQALLSESFARYRDLTTLQTITSLPVSGLYERLAGLCTRYGLGPQIGELCTSSFETPEARTVSDLWLVSRGDLDVEEFLLRHGYHSPVQGELAAPSWRMEPEPVLKLAESYRRASAELPPDALARQRLAERATIEAELLAELSRAARPLVRSMLEVTRRYLPLREVARAQFMQCYDVARAATGVLGQHLHTAGYLAMPAEVKYLTIDELASDARCDRELITFRRERCAVYETLDLPARFRGRPAPLMRQTSPERAELPVIHGLGGSGGQHAGIARVIDDPLDTNELAEGEILVCETTNPSWASYFLVAGAVVVDIGGPLSHGAIVAREMGIPCVINTRDARHRISTGDRIRVDGTAGVVEILERGPVTPAAARRRSA
jgi:phosphohistidine swiveling domain-containing protein